MVMTTEQPPTAGDLAPLLNQAVLRLSPDLRIAELPGHLVAVKYQPGRRYLVVTPKQLEQLQSFGLTLRQMLTTLLWEGRFNLLTTVLAGFGRAIGEIGAVLIVGGNIAHVTRVMTTTIALETARGNLAMALAIGIVLLGVAIGVNGAAAITRDYALRHGG